MNYQLIRYTAEAGIARIALHRPDKLNSFLGQMHEELRHALARVAPDGNRVLVLTGDGRGFCAGQDLAESGMNPDAGPVVLGPIIEKHYTPLVLALQALPVPVIAAVNGIAAGAGANVALACDVVIAARSASFIQAFSKIGLMPDAGGTWTLPRLVGHARAMGLALTGDRLTAEEAERWGLIWKCVDDDQFQQEVDALAAQMAQGPTGAYTRIRQAMLASWGNDMATQLNLERDGQHALGQAEDFAEGVRAFQGKRPAKFTGR